MKFLTILVLHNTCVYSTSDKFILSNIFDIKLNILLPTNVIIVSSSLDPPFMYLSENKIISEDSSYISAIISVSNDPSAL